MKCPKCKVELQSMKCPKCGVLYKTKAPVSKGTSKQKKRSISLLISAILGSLYFVYLIVYFGGVIGGSSSDAEMVGAAIASFFVYPHLFMVFLAVLFNWLGFGLSSRGLSLTGGILYCVAAALFPMYAFFVIIQIILSFVGFVRLKK